jgi:putative transposase
MVAYRRHHIPSGTYFFTVNLQNRSLSLLIDHINLLRFAFLHTQQNMPFKIIAIVIMPDHLHTIWQLPEGDNDYSRRWQLIKSKFTQQVRKEKHFQKNKKGEYGIWQRRFWEHTIKNENDLNRHIDYIHFNPVKHGYVKTVKEWKYSSFSKYVKNDVLPLNWGGDYQETEQVLFGE